MKIKTNILKVAVAVLTGVLSVSLLSTPLQAASSTHAIRFVKTDSAGFAWVLENKAAQADYTNFVQYYTPTVKLLEVIAPVGGTLNLKWKVTDSQGKALPNTDVTLVLNPAYTNGVANTVTEDGITIPLAKGGSKDGLDIPLKTDADGFVTYTLTNKDSVGDKNIPNDGSTVPDWQSAFKYTQVQLWVGKFASQQEREPVQKIQDQDILEIHFTEGVKAEKADQQQVTHKTDAYGNVSFVMKNLDKPGTGEPEPESMNAKPNISADGLNDLHSQVLPEIAGEKPDHSVITEFHYYDPKTPAVQSATKPTIRLVSPVLDDVNSIHREDLEKVFSVDNNWYAKGIGFRQAYVQTGSALNLVYKVTDDNGKALANTTVKLHVNKAYSASKAGMTDGTTATDPAKDSSQGNDQALLTGTTDGFGYVLFALKNTEKKGEPIPAALTTPTPTSNGLFSQIFPEITGAATDVADMVEFHFIGDAAVAAVPASTAVSVKATASKATVKGKTVYSVTVAIANASGKSAAISITGLKKVTEKISVANQAFKYTVTAGAKTVSVVISGKTYTTKLTAK